MVTFPLRKKENPLIPNNTHASVEFSPKPYLSQYLVVHSVYLGGNRHCYAFQIVTSCKIKHVQLKNSSPWGCREQHSLEAKAQRHRFWKWVLMKYQTSSCPLERNAPMPGPLLFQENHCSLTSVNRERANILITSASTLEPALWIPGKSKSNLLSWEVLSWACVKINQNTSNT